MGSWVGVWEFMAVGPVGVGVSELAHDYLYEGEGFQRLNPKLEGFRAMTPVSQLMDRQQANKHLPSSSRAPPIQLEPLKALTVSQLHSVLHVLSRLLLNHEKKAISRYRSPKGPLDKQPPYRP